MGPHTTRRPYYEHEKSEGRGSSKYELHRTILSEDDIGNNTKITSFQTDPHLDPRILKSPLSQNDEHNNFG